MDTGAAEQLIADLYRYALGRQPAADEFAGWVRALTDGNLAPETAVRAFLTCDEFRKRSQVNSIYPAGHFYSPLVDPPAVRDYVARERQHHREDLAPIRVAPIAMRILWETQLPFIQTTPFTDEKIPDNRYHYVGGPFTYGDAITLRMMIAELRPQRIIEIGSGFSSACILDSVDHVGLSDFRLTCIEPYPERLRTLLRDADFARVELIEAPVQDVPPDIVDALGPNDVLFIDSTHVLKTGSDVHYELFYLLPRLKPGVFVHFHDVEFPFEYPDQWIFDENRSWNEIYALRAFLMFNDAFEIVFWPSLFGRVFAHKIKDEFPIFLKNSGCSIWLRRRA